MYTRNNQRLGSAFDDLDSTGSLLFAKLVMVSSAPAKSAEDARYTSQDPFIHLLIDRLSHAISTPNTIKSAFFLHQMQLNIFIWRQTFIILMANALGFHAKAAQHNLRASTVHCSVAFF